MSLNPDFPALRCSRAGGLVLAIVAALCGLGLLALAAWFITATALVGAGLWSALRYNLFAPSAPIRLLALARPFVRYAERLTTHRVTMQATAQLKEAFFRGAARLTPAQRQAYGAGSLLGRLTTELDLGPRRYLLVGVPLGTAALAGGLAVGWVRRYDAGLAGALAAGLLGVGALGFLVPARAGRRPAGRLLVLGSHLRTALFEHLRGYRELLVFGALRPHGDRLRAGFDQLARAQGRSALALAAAEAGRIAGAGLCWLAVLYLALGLHEAGQLTAAQLVMLVVVALGTLELLAALPPAGLHLGSTWLAIARTKAFLALPTAAAAAAPTPSRLPTFNWEMRGLCFGYGPSQLVLNNLSWQLPAGCRAALTGPNGMGKTTLLHLMAGLYAPAAGCLTLGGLDLRDADPAALRRHVSLLEQHVVLFDTTIFDNVRLACPSASLPQLAAALRQARLLDWVQSLPDGWHTRVGESGTHVSAGQARRLGLARIFLQNAPVVLLDEPTAGLDAEAEQEVLAALEALPATTTLLVVTHRPAVLARFALRFRLENSRICPE